MSQTPMKARRGISGEQIVVSIRSPVGSGRESTSVGPRACGRQTRMLQSQPTRP